MKSSRLQKAYDRQLSYELCDDLAGKFARKSATTPNDIGDIRLTYSEIVMHLRGLEPLTAPVSRAAKKRIFAEFVRAGGSREALAVAFSKLLPKQFRRSLSERLRTSYQTDPLAKRLLADLEQCVRSHLDRLNDGEAAKGCRLDGEVLSVELVRVLAKEWLRDGKRLMDFLLAVLQRWRKIDQPGSVWRRRTLTFPIAAQVENERKGIADRLQELGVIPPKLTAKQLDAWLGVIGQDISRGANRTGGKVF